MRTSVLACFALAVASASLAACERQERVAARPAPALQNTPPVASPRQQAAPAPVPASVPRDALTDSAITAKIKAGILSDPAMAGTDVSVNTDRGVVSLAGLIKSQDQAALASAHAQRQDGVMRVDTHLSVAPS